MKIKTLFAALACTAALSACGGGKATDSSKAALLGACDPASGPAGTQVTCPVVKDVADDCTFFFAGQPTDFVLDAENGSFSFTVPTATAVTEEMSFQCGDGEPLSAGTFDVIASANQDVSAPSNSDETIEPTGTTGGTGTGDATTGGTTGDATTGGTTTGGDTAGTTTTSSATINSFTVIPITESSARQNTFQVSYSYSNAQAAYIWGNMLNRNSWDGTLGASESCKLQGGRYLATNNDGTDLIAGSETYTKWQYLSEGSLCDDSTECLSQSTTAHLALHAVQAPVIGQATSSTLKPVLIGDTTPNCRMNLNQTDGTLVTSDSFYTRSLVQYGSLCLAVEGTDGAWQVQCVSGDLLNAHTVDLDGSYPVTIKPLTDKIGYSIHLQAVNATAIQVYCSRDDEDLDSITATVDANTGSATFSSNCEVTSEKETVTVRLYGVGDNNVKVKTYTLAMDKPDVKLNLFSSAPTNDKSSKIDFTYSATRHYTFTDEAGAVVSEGDAAWLKQRKFTGFKNAQDKDSLDGEKHDVTNPGQLDGTINNVVVDHDHTEWTYKVFDFDGNDYKDSYSAPKDTFTTSSSLTYKEDSKGHGNGYGGTGDHDCSKALDLTVWGDYDWTAQNLGSAQDVGSIFVVSGDCDLSFESGGQPDPDKYGLQSGTLRLTKHFSKQKGSYDVLGSCTVRFLYWDESWSDQTISMEFQCKDGAKDSLKGSVLENVVD